MRKLTVVALAAALALVLSGCELITGNDSKSNSTSTTPSVHGTVTVTYTGAGAFPTDARLAVYVFKTGTKAALTPNYSKAISAGGNYQYSVTGVADGSYTVTVDLEQVNGSGTSTGNNYGSPSPTSQDVTVTGGAASVGTFTISYDGSGAQGS